MSYSLLRFHSIRMKSINHLVRNHAILIQYYYYKFSKNLQFSTNTSINSNYSPEKWNLDNFITQYSTFKPLMERSNLGILIDFEDYKKKKKLLKESIRSLEYDLDSFDNKTLFGILLYCLEMSDKCLNDTFNLRLVELLISRFQSIETSNNNSSTNSISSSSNNNNTMDSTNNNITSNSNTINTNTFINTSSNLTIQNNILSLDYSLISKIFDEQVHIVYLLSSFHKLKLYLNLDDHFEFFYLNLNRNISNYSSDNLVDLCNILGDLYYFKNLPGIKLLIQKCIYSLLEQIDKYNVNISIYNWINIIKSIDKCNENHLFKKLIPYLISTIQSNPFNTGTSNCYFFDFKTDTYKISKEESKKYYKFVKLNVQLLDTVLTTGIIDNTNLFDSIFQLISNYLLFYTNKTSKFKSININNNTMNTTTNNNYNNNINNNSNIRSNNNNTISNNTSINNKFINNSNINILSMFSGTKINNEYNQPNELVNELLYKKYNNKLFKSPSYNPTTTISSIYSNTSDSEKSEKNLLQYALSNMLNNGNVVFIRSLKICEMYIRTLYPNLYNKLNKNILLQVIKQLPFESEKEYNYVTNIINNNKELIQKYVNEQESPLIVLVGVYYLICTNYNKKVYIEIIENNNNNKKNKYNGNNININDNIDKDNNNNNKIRQYINKDYETQNNSHCDNINIININNNINSDGYFTNNKTNKLNNWVEFKQQYLKSLGWTCIQIYK